MTPQGAGSRAVARVWRSRVFSTYTLLLAILGLGSYAILFSHPSVPFTSKGEDTTVSDSQLEVSINNARNQILHVNYEPVFEKHYVQYYGNEEKKTNISAIYHTQNRKFPTPKYQNGGYNKARTRGGNDLRREMDMKMNALWRRADEAITRDALLSETNLVHEVLDALASARIVAVDVLDIGDYESGTSEKWVVSLQGGQKAVIKLMWEPKGRQKPGGLCNYGYEMPWAEIAGFHLHRVLGFYNTPYVAGRRIDIRREILPVASPRVARRIKLGAGKQLCVVGQCHYCTRENRLCTQDGLLEVSLGYWIPRHLELYTWWPDYMPWSTPRMNQWKEVPFNNRSYCEKVRNEIEPYDTDDYYYDLFDFAVLDTLMYHFDSKHYIIIDESSARGLTIRLDHGRAFCRHDIDEDELFLAPLYQCCTLRRSTYDKLMRFQRTTLFSRQLKQHISVDVLAPLLNDDWFKTFERRLGLIFKAIEKCATANKGLDHILVE